MNIRTLPLAICLLLTSVFTCFSSADADTWTDSTGKFKIQAEFVQLKDGKVQLRTDEDGRLLWIELAKLSAADRKKAERMALDLKKSETQNNPSLQGLELSAKVDFDQAFPGSEPYRLRLTAKGEPAALARKIGKVRVTTIVDRNGSRIPVVQDPGLIDDIEKSLVLIQRNRSVPADVAGFELLMDHKNPPGEIAKFQGEFQLLTGGDRKLIRIANVSQMLGKVVDDPTLKRLRLQVSVGPANLQGGLSGIRVTVRRAGNVFFELQLKDENGEGLSELKRRGQLVVGPKTEYTFGFNGPVPEEATLFIEVVENLQTLTVPFDFTNVKVPKFFDPDALVVGPQATPKTVNFSKSVSSLPKSISWKVEVDAAQASEPHEFELGMVLKGPKIQTRRSTERVKGFLADPRQQVAVASVDVPFDNLTGVTVFDLNNSTILGTGVYKANPAEPEEMLAYSRERGELLTRIRAFGPELGKLVFRPIDDLSSTVNAWKTSGPAVVSRFLPAFAHYVSSNRLLTIGSFVILWDLDSDEPIYSISLTREATGNRSFQDVSPGGKVLAVSTRFRVILINIADGALLGEIKYSGGVKFSPDGKLLAIKNSEEGVLIWDLEANQLKCKFGAPYAGMAMTWADNRYLLIGGEKLYDIENRVLIWNYKSASTSATALGGGYGVIHFGNNLKFVRIPHIDFRDKIEDFGEVIPLITPDSTFALDLDLPFDFEQNEIVEKKLEAYLNGRGFKVDPHSTLVIQGRVEKLEPQTVEIAEFAGFGPSLGKVTYSAHRSTARVLKDGKPIWSYGILHGPGHFLSPRNDESLQSYFDRISQPKPEFFYQVRFPSNLYTLPGDKPLGTKSLWDLF